MMDAMLVKAENQANEYAALTDDAKTVYLDKIIDEMQARRAEFLRFKSKLKRASAPTSYRHSKRVILKACPLSRSCAA